MVRIGCFTPLHPFHAVGLVQNLDSKLETGQWTNVHAVGLIPKLLNGPGKRLILSYQCTIYACIYTFSATSHSSLQPVLLPPDSFNFSTTSFFSPSSQIFNIKHPLLLSSFCFNVVHPSLVDCLPCHCSTIRVRYPSHPLEFAKVGAVYILNNGESIRCDMLLALFPGIPTGVHYLSPVHPTGCKHIHARCTIPIEHASLVSTSAGSLAAQP